MSEEMAVGLTGGEIFISSLKTFPNRSHPRLKRHYHEGPCGFKKGSWKFISSIKRFANVEWSLLNSMSHEGYLAS